MEILKAINPKHQSKVNRAVKTYERYSSLSNLRDIADGEGDTKSFKKYDRMCASIWDKYLWIVDELPIREVNNIERTQH